MFRTDIVTLAYASVADEIRLAPALILHVYPADPHPLVPRVAELALLVINPYVHRYTARFLDPFEAVPLVLIGAVHANTVLVNRNPVAGYHPNHGAAVGERRAPLENAEPEFARSPGKIRNGKCPEEIHMLHH